MEAWIHKKTLLIENLLSMTSQLIDSVGTEDWDQFDAHLRRRAQLFSELQKLDTQFGGHPSGEEGKWLKQLQALDEMGKVLEDRMLSKKVETIQGIQASRDQKLEWVRENLLNQRGNRVELKA